MHLQPSARLCIKHPRISIVRGTASKHKDGFILGRGSEGSSISISRLLVLIAPMRAFKTPPTLGSWRVVPSPTPALSIYLVRGAAGKRADWCCKCQRACCRVIILHIGQPRVHIYRPILEGNHTQLGECWVYQGCAGSPGCCCSIWIRRPTLISASTN